MSFPFLIDDIFSLTNSNEFEKYALELFRYQAVENKVYQRFINFLKVNPENVRTLAEIPFLPIGFFKSFEIKTGEFSPEITFTSSATTGSIPSKHLVKDKTIYFKSFEKAFKLFYADISEKPLLALLPSYLEREGSSLIVMADALIKQSKRPESGFFLNNYEALVNTITDLENKGETYFLLGVSFALLDLAEQFNLNLKNAIVIETGGMKGRRKEITRSELHKQIKKGLGVSNVESEYGMTELLSQAYARKIGLFETPPWMKVLARDTTDPLNLKTTGRGGINIIDLANIHSCAFIATQDLGKLHSNGKFEVLGRFDNAEVRGCNLMFS